MRLGVIKFIKARKLIWPLNRVLGFLEHCKEPTKLSDEKINIARPFRLLGPPELGCLPPLSSTTTATAENNLIKSLINQDTGVEPSEEAKDDDSDYDHPINMGFTENYSPTFLSSGNPCLDFFFHVLPDTKPPELIRRLESAWSHNALTASKLVCNLRGVRGTGKNDKEGYYTAAIWLYQYHPKTLAGNVKVFADFGYFKDLLEILYRILEGPLIRKIQKQEFEKKSGGRRKLSFGFGYGWGLGGRMRSCLSGRRRNEKVEKVNRPKKENEERMEKIMKNLEEMKLEKENARTLRIEKQINKARKALDYYYLDEKYQLLHDKISDFFAERLKSDMEKLSCGDLRNISLAAKWCPSLDSSYDKATLMCESIARKMFPKENHSEYEGIEEAHYAYRVRDRLRKEVLVPLRKALELPEVFMSARQWKVLPYNKVASVAMRNYAELFLRHDGKRFNQYLRKVERGEAKIAAGALLPHEIIWDLNYGETGQVAELQWRRMVNDLLEKGKLKNCLAISDVSGSMSGTPMEVSVALGVLVSELSEEPWKGKLITFSANPQLQEVKGDTLKAKTNFVRRMEWGMNTDFQKAFDCILDVAVEEKLSEERMIKRVFVFSDMEFDQASTRPWETDYQAIQRKFREKGYQNVPEIVFWNLRDSYSTPVTANQSGVALVSGFSKNMLTMFLEGGGVITPEWSMEVAISGEEYQRLVVFD